MEKGKSKEITPNTTTDKGMRKKKGEEKENSGTGKSPGG